MSIVAGCAGDLRKAEQEIRTVSGRFVKDRRTEIFTVEPFRLKKDTIILKGETTLPQAKETLIIALNERHINLKDSILILPDVSAGQRHSGLTILSVINLRKELTMHQSWYRRQ
jgi:gamma-D-glutamyl-L-lysine dipeptidyl-peptidase